MSIGAGAAVAACWIVAVVLTGSPALDVLRWVGATLTAVLIPGFVLVRVSRRGSAPLIEDAAWAVPAGSLVAVAGWFVDRVLPVSPGAFVFGPLVTALTLTVPAARARTFARPAPGWGVRPNLAMAAIAAFSLVWVATTGLQPFPLNPGPGATTYYPDVLYQLSLVGELHRTVVPTYPMVAGTKLSYHWFLYAIINHLTTHTGVGRFDATLRLSLASMVPAMLVLAAVVARRLSGRVSAGVLAACMLGVLELSLPEKWGPQFGSVILISRYWEASPPQSLGWIAGLAALGTVCALLRRGPNDTAVPVALMVPFLVLCAGSKSSQLPVLGCGLVLALLVACLQRQWDVARRCLIAAAAVGAVFEAAAYTIYGGSSYGVRQQWWGYALSRLYQEFPSQQAKSDLLYLAAPHARRSALLTIVALLVIPLLPRLLGLLYQVRLRPNDPAGWVAGGVMGAGLLAPFVLRHPAGSELYFLISAYPLGVVGAAGGLVLAVDHGRRLAHLHNRTRRHQAVLLLALASGAAAAFAVAHLQPRFDPVTRWIRSHPADVQVRGVSFGRLLWLWWRPWVQFTGLAVALTLVATIALRRLAAPRRPGTVSGEARVRMLAGLTFVSILLGAGLYGMSLRIYGSDLRTPTQDQRAPVSDPAHGASLIVWPDTEAAGSWIDRHAAAQDVVATNQYCLRPRVRPDGHTTACDTRNFTAAAFSQRRTLIGGWAYADRVLDSAWASPVSYTKMPFWDAALYDEQYQAFARPSRAVLDDLYRRHDVRWLFLDLTHPPVATALLDRTAIRRFTGAHAAVWQLRRPN